MAERFDRYQHRCLYDPHDGFYATGRGAGRRSRDFITSPEVGPLFGAVLARCLTSWWHDSGEPASWVVCEAGAGRGTLERAVRAATDAEVPLKYLSVEFDDDMPDRADVIMANELLDNLPARVVERTETGWAELWVPEDWHPTEIELPVDVPVGVRLPVLGDAAAWVADARSRAARVLAFDYGVATTAELAERVWLRTYAEHRMAGDPFVEPGSVDITVDIAVDQLPRPSRLETQAEFLRRWGIDELVDEGRRIWAERAHLGDLEAVRARSRVQEAAALLDPDGLGAFLSLEWS